MSSKNIFENGTEDAEAVLSAASELLASSLDYETTLRHVVTLVMPLLADFGFFDVVEGSQVRRIAYAYQDPRRQAILDTTRWNRSERKDLNLCALSSGSSGLHPAIDDAWLRDVAVAPAHYDVMRELGFRSMLTVPCRCRGELMGALTLFFADSGRVHTPQHVRLAEELGHRAAMAVDNARHYAEAQAAIRKRDEFLSVASHELKTPLTALQLHVAGLMQLAQREPEAGALPVSLLMERLRRVEAQSRRMGQLVDSLLDVSQLSSGRLELDRRDMDLRALTQEVVARFSHRGPDEANLLALDLPDAVRGHWDWHRLDQVLTQLLSNALKYGGTSPVEVRLWTEGPHALWRVRDHGIGIQEEDRARIFERFERASLARHFGGLGLGLWIAREPTQAHGGTLVLEEVSGPGAAFTVRLPLAEPLPNPV